MTEFERFCFWLKENKVLSEEFKSQITAKVNNLMFESHQRGVELGKRDIHNLED